MEYGRYYLDNDVLMSEGGEVINFADRDVRIRHHGWLAGGGFLPYPFDDKISDKEWESGSFRNKE